MFGLGLEISSVARGQSLLSQVISMLRSVGGSLWLPANVFTDSSGTGSVSEGGAVGYMADRATMFGQQLAINGDFTNGTSGWTAFSNAQLDVIAGELRVTATTTEYARATQQIPVTIGSRYLVTWRARRGAQNQPAWLIVQGAVASPINNAATDQTMRDYSCEFIATGNTLSLSAQCINLVGVESFFDDIKVVEVLVGNRNVTQPTTSAKPLLNGSALIFDGANDFLTADVAIGGAADYTLIVAANTANLTGVKGLVMLGDTASSTNRAGVFFNGDRVFAGVTPNGLGGVDIASSAISTGSRYVLANTKSGNTQQLYLNGVLSNSNDVSAANSNPATFNKLAIGAFQRSSANNFHTGMMWGVIFAPVALTGAQRKLCEKLLAQLSGATLQ